jgi:hypothetical protein
MWLCRTITFRQAKVTALPDEASGVLRIDPRGAPARTKPGHFRAQLRHGAKVSAAAIRGAWGSEPIAIRASKSFNPAPVDGRRPLTGVHRPRTGRASQSAGTAGSDPILTFGARHAAGRYPPDRTEPQNPSITTPAISTGVGIGAPSATSMTRGAEMSEASPPSGARRTLTGPSS